MKETDEELEARIKRIIALEFPYFNQPAFIKLAKFIEANYVLKTKDNNKSKSKGKHEN